jgi:hypothetical protein
VYRWAVWERESLKTDAEILSKEGKETEYALTYVKLVQVERRL